MNLYKIGGAFATLVCIGILVFSYFSWQEKLEAAGNPTREASTQTVNAKSKTQTTQTASNGDNSVNTELFANMDESVRNIFVEKNEKNEVLQLLIMGSKALEFGDPGYAERFQSSIESAYGESVDITIDSIDGTSDALQYVNLEAGYDVVLLEPLTLMNNDRLSIEEERQDIEDFSVRLEQTNPNAAVVLHPPQPIYGAGYYRAQVQALEEFADLYGYPYIDHWNAWPATDDISLKEHLNEDAVPNSKGAEAWATELNNYFIAN